MSKQCEKSFKVDVYKRQAKNSALAPAMANYGNIPWENAGEFSETASVNSYLIEAEGIYAGYRYYETRYADIVLGNGGSDASAGTYANADGTVAVSYTHLDVYKRQIMTRATDIL